MIEVLNKIDETLIANISAELKRRDWSRAELARRLGKEPMVVTRLMNRAVWDSELLQKLSEVIGKPPAWLLTDHSGSEPPTPDEAVLFMMEYLARVKKK